VKAVVDPGPCSGCGVCEDLCPAVFIILDGVAKVRINPVPPANEQACRDAARDCPVDAIKIEE